MDGCRCRIKFSNFRNLENMHSRTYKANFESKMLSNLVFNQCNTSMQLSNFFDSVFWVRSSFLFKFRSRNSFGIFVIMSQISRVFTHFSSLSIFKLKSADTLRTDHHSQLPTSSAGRSEMTEIVASHLVLYKESMLVIYGM